MVGVKRSMDHPKDCPTTPNKCRQSIENLRVKIPPPQTPFFVRAKKERAAEHMFYTGRVVQQLTFSPEVTTPIDIPPRQEKLHARAKRYGPQLWETVEADDTVRELDFSDMTFESPGNFMTRKNTDLFGDLEKHNLSYLGSSIQLDFTK